MVAKICGVPAETIKQLAADFSIKRTNIVVAGGCNFQRHGEQTHCGYCNAPYVGQIGVYRAV